MRIILCRRTRRAATATATALWALSVVSLLRDWPLLIHVEIVAVAATLSLAAVIACLGQLLDRALKLGYDVGLYDGSNGTVVPVQLQTPPGLLEATAGTPGQVIRAGVRFASRISRRRPAAAARADGGDAGLVSDDRSA